MTYTPAPFITESGERGWVVVFNDISDQKTRELLVRREFEELSWVDRIRTALDDDRFVLYAQPIVEIASGETAHHEMLLRMRGSDGEVIAAGAFLPIAERHGLMGSIDRRVIEMSFAHASAGHRIAINLSAESMSDPGLFGFVEQQLKTHDVDPRLIIFEITETALIHNEEIAQTFTERVRGLNCAVALDDSVRATAASDISSTFPSVC